MIRGLKGTRARVGLPAGFSGLDPPDRWPCPRSAPRPERLEAGVETLHGVGPTLARRLARIGVETVGDLLWQRPRRYEEPAPSKRVCDLFGEDDAVIEVVVRSASSRRRGRLRILTAQVADETGEIKATWFNQPWLEGKLAPGTRLRLRGRANRYGFAVSSYDLEGEGVTADFAPVYPASEDLAQKRLRDLHSQAVALVRDAGEPLSATLLAEERLPIRADALAAVHAPRVLAEAEVGRARLAFDELLVLRLALARTAAERERASAVPLGEPGELIARYRASLPFTLTTDQERSITEIDTDLERSTPMQRLLQGDVGSGKTVVALYALLRAVELGRQGALMAPTETLAEQHFLTIDELCAPLGVRVVLLTSSLRAREHSAARQLISSGDAHVVVGTHALIQKEVEFRDLSVAVVDEQHRFGVGQRTALVENRSPHVLHLTATPIPRTLALTVYGDLEVSELSLPPANRKPVVTAWVTEDRSSEAYTRLRRHLDDRRQAYVVCPLIEESETKVARAAEAEAERLRDGELRGYRVACLHGRLPPAERRGVMASFKAGEVDVLVATTVIEVGVDVSNATIMIVQEADRFGLAQLHQLRGRVGRGAEQSYCLLVSRAKEELNEGASDRLEAMVATTDGFELAERDLEIRGEGQLLGARQSGYSDLRFVRLRHDQRLLERARAVARDLDEEGLLGDDVDRLLGEAAHLGDS
ncbi:MAG: ATP-dependent DNA helicase RecG [Thermoleophilia bacterium]|nr:ATP-dependent DNA helicase RecG [Thermoleophilia bacterium]